MITPRRTRLLRAPDLPRFRRAIVALCEQAPGAPIVLVPTAAARHQLLRVSSWRCPPNAAVGAAVGRPIVLTRDELYELLHARLAHPPTRLGHLERAAIAQAAAVTVAGRSSSRGGEPEVADGTLPFALRPGLVAEMLRFYDQLRRQSRQVERFQELIEETLGGAGYGDRGTDRMLAQTRVLADVFREYERRVSVSGRCDEHTLRERLMGESLSVPPSDVVVTVADWIAEPDGLFIADFDLLARMPGVQRIDLVCTEQLLGSGFHERLHDWWPGLEEIEVSQLLGETHGAERPVLETPTEPPDRHWFTLRDRQEELTAVAQHVKAARRRRDQPALSLNRTAVVFKKPLPYLYLARATLGAAGLPFQTFDARPLASEPLVATVDLVLDAIETRFAREALVALLRAPHVVAAGTPEASAIHSFDRALRIAGYLGELDRLEAIAGEWRRDDTKTPDAAVLTVLDAALGWVRSLVPCLEPSPASVQLRRLHAVLSSRLSLGADPGGAPLWSTREHDARDAVLRLVEGLGAAHQVYHDPIWTAVDVAAAVRTAIEDQTFGEVPAGEGVRLLDDRAARYADLDDMTIVGLTDTDWPERQPRNVFYPSGLLKALGWPSEHTRRRAADARFVDLLGSAKRRVAVTTIALDDEAIVTPSVTLDEMPRARLTTVAVRSEAARLTPNDALSLGEVSLEPLDQGARDWAHLRIERSPATDPRFHGFLGARPGRQWSVGALEVYLACPFKFFAQHVLRLEEEVEDSDVMDPRQQGQFVHGVFEAFFHAWQRTGHGTITPELLDRARSVFTAVVDAALVTLPEAEAGLERTRLLGSSAAAGLGEAVMRMEAERPVAVVERLLEHRLDGPVTVETSAGARTIGLKGKADRIDLLEDGTFRLIDYKLGWPPARSRALQLAIYAVAAEQQLAGRHGKDWTLGEAAYVAFKGPRRIVPFVAAGGDRARALADAGQRAADVVDAIGRGEFPPTPDDVFLCERCSYASICRKDYVGDV